MRRYCEDFKRVSIKDFVWVLNKKNIFFTVKKFLKFSIWGIQIVMYGLTFNSTVKSFWYFHNGP